MYIHYCKTIGVYYDSLDSFCLFVQDNKKVRKVAFKLCSEHSEKVEGYDTVYCLLTNFLKYILIIKDVTSLFFKRLGYVSRHAFSVLP